MTAKSKYRLSLLLTISLMLTFILYPKLSIEGATNGLLLWFNKVLPSLFPFIVLTNILASLNIVSSLCIKLSPLSQKILGLSGNSLFVFVISLIAGYPTGAKLTAQLLTQKQLSLDEAERIIGFSNNCGPLFIVGTVGTLLLHRADLGYFLLFVHILSALTLLLLFSFSQRNTFKPASSSVLLRPSSTSFASLLTQAIEIGMDTLVYVGGYIIFFSVIVHLISCSSFINTCLEILSHYTCISVTLFQGLLLGSLELSTGMATLSHFLENQFSLNLLAAMSALISFGGFCVYFQALHFLQAFSLKTKLYLIYKSLQAVFSAIYVYLFYPLLLNITQKTPFYFSFKSFLLLVLTFVLSFLLLESKSLKFYPVKKELRYHI